MRPLYYFAYGSNLDKAQMLCRCPDSRPVEVALLKNYGLAFGGYSERWGGSVATIECAPGYRVPGLLYEISPSDLESLDYFEGHPKRYQRKLVPVLANGRKLMAWTYILSIEGRKPAAKDYLAVINRAYHELGLDAEPLLETATLSYKVFLYGTLKMGHGNHHLLGSSKLLGKSQTKPNFSLLNLGPFPAMIRGGQTRILGEIYSVDHCTLKRLDELEGHPRFYKRQKIILSCTTKAWTYVYQGERRGILVKNGIWEKPAHW